MLDCATWTHLLPLSSYTVTAGPSTSTYCGRARHQLDSDLTRTDEAHAIAAQSAKLNVSTRSTSFSSLGSAIALPLACTRSREPSAPLPGLVLARLVVPPQTLVRALAPSLHLHSLLHRCAPSASLAARVRNGEKRVVDEDGSGALAGGRGGLCGSARGWQLSHGLQQV